MTLSTLPCVSIVVPVFNDAIGLKRCLQALEQQTYPPDSYEVIVVDNGSSNESDIAGVVNQFKQAVLAVESQPGSYAARNRGISLAKGAIIAFTDADCIPAADWIEQGVKLLQQNPKCGFVAGKIEVSFQDKDHPTAVELYESLWYPLPQKEFVEQHHFGATANIFTFTEVLQKVGVFDSTLKSNGDREWGQRVHAAGYLPVYGELVRITHPARYSLPQLHARARRIMGGRYDFLEKKEPSFFKRNAALATQLVKYLVAPILMIGFNLFLDKRLKTFRQRVEVTLLMFFVSYVYVWEIVRLKCGGKSYRG